MKTTITSSQDMIALGAQLAKQYKKILLHGELGAGKTHLSKGFAQYHHINSDDVTSPTYTYLNIYDNKVLHIDMYRVESEKLLQEKGILDLIEDHDYVIIERPKFTHLYLDDSRVDITIHKTGEETREVSIVENFHT